MEDKCMDAKNLKMIKMYDFMHLGGTSYSIAARFKLLIDSGMIDINSLRLITVDYDTTHGDVCKGPVRMYFENGLEIRLNLTAGYSGSGPRDLCEVLNLCNVVYNEQDILSNQDTVNLKLIPRGHEDTFYQFHTYDDMFVYSWN
jgi:hypothetical protein